VAVGGVVDCDTCHNAGLPGIQEVRLPSGVPHPVSGFEAACFTCHQGRASSATVDTAVGTGADDDVDPTLRFINPHYSVAAAALLG